MTSSSSFEVIVGTGESQLWRGRFDLLEIPVVVEEAICVSADTSLWIEVKCPRIDVPLRVLLGNEVMATIDPGTPRISIPESQYFHHEFGESQLVLEQLPTERNMFRETMLCLPIHVVPRDSVVRDYHVMVKDVARVHQGLAYDIMGRTSHSQSLSDVEVRTTQPDFQVEQLRQLLEEFTECVAAINLQPSSSLTRQTVLARYRGGDHVSPSSVAALARDRKTRIDSTGAVQFLDRARVSRPIAHTDIAEHRHIAETLRQLRARGRNVALHCRRTAETVKREEARWQSDDPRGDAINKLRDLPRVVLLEELADEASQLADQFAFLLSSSDILRSAGQPRRPFGPTPIFMGRPAYRQMFKLISQARVSLGLLVDGESLRVAFRNLATLYEYWCFIRVVDFLNGHFGPPEPHMTYDLVDDVYRPTLTPEQAFRFQVERGLSLVVTYEPRFHREPDARRLDHDFAAAFTWHSLCPDITIELNRSGKRTVLLALDAKSTERFRPRAFRGIADYSRQIYEWRTGYQPIKQVFLLHRDRERQPEANLPMYLKQRIIPQDSVVLGAVPCIPEHVGVAPRRLQEVVSLFLRRYAGIELETLQEAEEQ